VRRLQWELRRLLLGPVRLRAELLLAVAVGVVVVVVVVVVVAWRCR
jgi:hypothetical protein